MGMALCASPSLLTSIPMVFPAKIPSSSNVSILRTSRVILHLCPSTPPRSLPIPPRAAPPQKYVYPDPIPEFAASETQKFRDELVKKLSEERETFGDDLEAVVEVCAKILDEFLQKEYGGPGTLLVEPFTDMFVALKGKKLPGASFAARASLLWAQNFVDQDWETWNRNNHQSKHP
ncbi:protein PLASTID REDOX INSENSITIVE 2, chloroplastic-like isoform X2 [Diospyros lotus]|uniref:protein PLASTID REDOX INSENSITIVE 2, chloroplastic-like isoform X2 n=1 Tax=Diospyros lotus TaxID=55363 RepID=UPI0022592D74|nr:protein PLASTID REDOX INSENSITIVE 2, chloroplastic-like isoform X2 [Diospyros lotus]